MKGVEWLGEVDGDETRVVLGACCWLRRRGERVISSFLEFMTSTSTSESRGGILVCVDCSEVWFMDGSRVELVPRTKAPKAR